MNFWEYFSRQFVRLAIILLIIFACALMCLGLKYGFWSKVSWQACIRQPISDLITSPDDDLFETECHLQQQEPDVTQSLRDEYDNQTESTETEQAPEFTNETGPDCGLQAGRTDLVAPEQSHEIIRRNAFQGDVMNFMEQDVAMMSTAPLQLHIHGTGDFGTSFHVMEDQPISPKFLRFSGPTRNEGKQDTDHKTHNYDRSNVASAPKQRNRSNLMDSGLLRTKDEEKRDAKIPLKNELLHRLLGNTPAVEYKTLGWKKYFNDLIYNDLPMSEYERIMKFCMERFHPVPIPPDRRAYAIPFVEDLCEICGRLEWAEVCVTCQHRICGIGACSRHNCQPQEGKAFTD